MKNSLLAFFLIFFVFGCVSNNKFCKDENNSEEAEEEKICRSEKVMGSKIPQTTCYTKEELERLEEKSKKILEKEQRTRQQMKTMGGLQPE
jgi:thiamine biosynthesis lipoprotein ApbE